MFLFPVSIEKLIGDFYNNTGTVGEAQQTGI
jgi:hypothetical protein